MPSDDDDDIAVPDDGRHHTALRYYGVHPFARCLSCEWEGQTRDHDREAADDGRAHERQTS